MYLIFLLKMNEVLIIFFDSLICFSQLLHHKGTMYLKKKYRLKNLTYVVTSGASYCNSKATF